MRRRVIGVTVVVWAIIAAAAVGPRLGPGTPGVSQVGQLPPSPLVGVCLAEDDDGLHQVTCQAPHIAEVTRSWSAWDPGLTATARTALRGSCRQAAQEYLGTSGTPSTKTFVLSVGGAGWVPPPLPITIDLVTGPTPGDPIGYQACVIRVQSAAGPISVVQPVAGRAVELLPLARRPATMRACYLVRDGLPPTVACQTWHVGEVLAVLPLAAGQNPTTAALDPAAAQTCRDQAARLIGSTDPTFGGRLTIAVVARGQSARAPAEQKSLWPRQIQCVAEATGGRHLVGSVIGLADGPLPLR